MSPGETSLRIGVSKRTKREKLRKSMIVRYFWFLENHLKFERGENDLEKKKVLKRKKKQTQCLLL